MRSCNYHFLLSRGRQLIRERDIIGSCISAPYFVFGHIHIGRLLLNPTSLYCIYMEPLQSANGLSSSMFSNPSQIQSAPLQLMGTKLVGLLLCAAWKGVVTSACSVEGWGRCAWRAVRRKFAWSVRYIRVLSDVVWGRQSQLLYTVKGGVWLSCTRSLCGRFHSVQRLLSWCEQTAARQG